MVARFNEFIGSKLVGGALDGLKRHGVSEDAIDLAWVPGAYEIPLVAQKMAASGKYDAVITLGAVIKGARAHFGITSVPKCPKGVATASMNTGVPVIFGVLTTDTIEQAIERAGTKAGNSYDCAVSAIEMANLLKNL